MAKYYTQSFQNNGDKRHPVVWYYGSQPDHNHKAGNEFTKACLLDLVVNHKWNRKDIWTGHYASNQSKPPTGTRLSWKKTLKRDGTGKIVKTKKGNTTTITWWAR